MTLRACILGFHSNQMKVKLAAPFFKNLSDAQCLKTQKEDKKIADG